MGESVIFSVIYGLMFHSWAFAGVLFAILFALLRGQGTAVYAVFVLSFLWSFVFAAFGYGIGGWIGAMILGGVVFLNGVQLHFRDLKRSWVDADIPTAINAAQWRQGWQGPNLN